MVASLILYRLQTAANPSFLFAEQVRQGPRSCVGEVETRLANKENSGLSRVYNGLSTPEKRYNLAVVPFSTLAFVTFTVESLRRGFLGLCRPPTHGPCMTELNKARSI